MRMYATVLCLILVVLTAKCGKKISSSSGDQSAMAGKTESIKPDQIAGLPPDRSPGGLGSSGGLGGSAPPRFDSTTPSGSSGSADGGPGGGAGSGLLDIYFDYDRHTVRSDAVQSMDSNAKWVRAHKGQTVLIEGHCDERGTQAYNLVLGEKRAKATKRYLEDLGVPRAQLLTTSYGENRPFCNEQSEACYQKNRRAHFSVK